MHKPALLCLLLALTLTACGGGGTPTPVTPPKTDFIQPTSLEGTVQVVSVANNSTIRLRSDDGLETLSSAPITSSGGQFSFSLPLPNATLVSKLKSASVAETFGSLVMQGGDCTGSIDVSNLGTKIYVLSELQLLGGVKITKLSTAIISSSGGAVAFAGSVWIYSPSSVSVSGTQTCLGGSTNVANVYLKPGWNVIQASEGKGGLTMQSVDPAKTVWRDSKL